MRPYKTTIAIHDGDDGVEMIRHNDEFIQRDNASDGRRTQPFRTDDSIFNGRDWNFHRPFPIASDCSGYICGSGIIHPDCG